MPKALIVMPVYNGMPHLATAIQSILCQTYQDWSLLLINDGSTDGSRDFINQIDDSRIRVHHKPNTGLGDTLNCALNLCDAEYYVRMDCDDFSLPNRLSQQIAFLDANPNVGAVGSSIEYFVHDPVVSGWSPRMPLTHDPILAALLRVEHALSHSALAIRTCALQAVNGYRLKGIGEDWDMYLHLSEISRLANLPDVLLKYRLSTTSVTSTKWVDCVINNHYAVACYQARQSGKQEPSHTEFVAAFKTNIHAIRKAEQDGKSLTRYRQGIAHHLAGQKLCGYAYFAAAAALSPERVVGRLRRIVSCH